MKILYKIFLRQLFHAILHSLDKQWIKLIFDVIAHNMADHSNGHIMLKNNSKGILFLMILYIFVPAQIIIAFFIRRVIWVCHLLPYRPWRVWNGYLRHASRIFRNLRLVNRVQKVLIIADKPIILQLFVLHYRILPIYKQSIKLFKNRYLLLIRVFDYLFLFTIIRGVTGLVLRAI